MKRMSWYPLEVSPPIEGVVPSSWEDIVTFAARGGELLSNRLEDQEMAVLCLHLIQVSLALVNTLMLQTAVYAEALPIPHGSVAILDERPGVQ